MKSSVPTQVPGQGDDLHKKISKMSVWIDWGQDLGFLPAPVFSLLQAHLRSRRERHLAITVETHLPLLICWCFSSHLEPSGCLTAELTGVGAEGFGRLWGLSFHLLEHR